MDYGVGTMQYHKQYKKTVRHHYFLTLDRVSELKRKVTQKELLKMRELICTLIGLHVIQPYQVHCFEHKQDKKNGPRLHYHMIGFSYNSYIPHKSVKQKGWSNNIKKLKTLYDVANTAGYIQKLKSDSALTASRTGGF